MNVAAGAIAVFIKAYSHQATCHETEGVETLYLFLVWFAVVFCLWLFSFLRWNFSSRSRTIKTNHTGNLQSSLTNISFFYAGIFNHSVEDIVHFNGNRESGQRKKKRNSNHTTVDSCLYYLRLWQDPLTTAYTYFRVQISPSKFLFLPWSFDLLMVVPLKFCT